MSKNKKRKKQNSTITEADRIEREQRERQEKKSRQREIAITAILAVAGIVIVTVLLVALFHREHSAYETIVFNVGDEAVRQDEVNLCILQNVVNLGIDEDALKVTAEDGSSADEYYKKEIAKAIMDYKVECMIAEKLGISLDEEEEASIRSDAMEYFGKLKASVVNEIGITKDRLIGIYRQRYLAHKVEQSVTDKVEVTDVDKENQQFVSIYTLLFPKVEMDDQGNVVTGEDGVTPIMLTDEEIAKRKADADAAYKELTEEDADIQEVAKKYGVDIYSGLQSNMIESMDEPFATYAKELSEGEYSPVFEIASCYGIIEMVQGNNEQIAEQIMSRYRDDLAGEELSKQKSSWYSELGISEEPELSGKAWNQITLYDFVKYAKK